MAIYFAWALQLKEGGEAWYAEALQVLDSGTEALGENAALQELAIGIEIDSGALTRIDSLLRGSLQGSPRWILRRAEILEYACRCNWSTHR
jgi:hypothetical protein